MGFARFLRRRRLDDDRRREIESYIEIETDDNMARGMSHGEASAAARRKFGNPTSVREELYRMNTVAFFDSLAGELRYGLRTLRRSPGFAIAALLTLALGIGANTAVFSVLDSVLLKPLAYPRANEVVALHQVAPGAAGLTNVSDGLLLSPSLYVTYAEHNRAFQALGVWATETANVTGSAEPEEVRVATVSDGVLQTFDVPPAAGRWLSADDQVARGPKRAMLSYGYWQRRFGGQRSAIGANLNVDSQPREIVGVMPAGFRFADSDFDIITPLAFDRAQLILAGFGYRGVGRLKPGVTLAQADADLARLLPVWMDSWSNGKGTNPHIYETWRIAPALRPLKDEVVGGVRDVLWAVMATIGLVMLIACANMTNLLLVRADARQRELCLRAALGAGRWRIAGSLLSETFLLALGGGCLGVLLACWGLRVLLAVGPPNLPRLNEISIDGRTLAFTMLVSMACGLWLGLIPALKYGGGRLAAALRSAGRSVSASRERQRARNILAVAQIAMALVLLVSAGLMIRTVSALRHVAPGFAKPQQVQLARIWIPPSLVPQPELVTRMQNELVDKLAAIPGVSSAAFATSAPMEGIASDWDAIYVQDKPGSLDEIPPLRLFKRASPEYLRTMGTRLMAGRDFTWTDLYGKRPVCMVSENLARELWGGAGAAVGKRISGALGDSKWQEVIGVVEDVRENGAQEPAPPTVYWPAASQSRSAVFAVRSARAGSASLRSELNRAVWAVNASLPVAQVRTMQDIYEQSMVRTSFTMTMLEIAGMMALALGVIGIYGVISYAVSQRRREIGIRAALGAPQRELRSMFLRSGLGLALSGVAVGLPAAMLLMRSMRSLLFGIGPLDPVAYLAAPLVLVAAAVLASYIPARRAMRVDPVEALRAE